MNVKDCNCEACMPQAWFTGYGFTKDMRFIVCAICGNKRCPHATDHRNKCTYSNAPGQKGSSWENCPAQEGVLPGAVVIHPNRQHANVLWPLQKLQAALEMLSEGMNEVSMEEGQRIEFRVTVKRSPAGKYEAELLWCAPPHL